MANTLTALAPTLFGAAQVVSQEPVGVLDAISMNFDDKGVAIGDTIKVPIAPTRAFKTYTPAMTPSAGDDAVAAGVAIQITQNGMVDWHLTGEQIRSLENGADYDEWLRQMMVQGMRTLRNQAEADAAAAVKTGASRAVGTAGTTPFGADINLIPSLYKILRDNGAPMADLNLVIDSAAGLNLRKLGIIQQAYQAGNDQERRSGNLLRQFGFAITESAGIALHTKGTGTLYVTSGSTAPKVTDIALVTGSGTVLAGDVVTFAADSNNNYVINTGVTAPGTISLGRPGARVTIATANAMTIGGNYTPNVAFERSAVVGVMRPPLIPANPTIEQLMVSDAKGLTYLLCKVVGDGMVTFRLHLAWGFKVVNPEHVALLMG